ncbi:MAG: hypothetical protein E7632_02170 [Ruminococcaceae bacterium]|nr:hypothetical protein [Oscillospiraceae bacterium]
MLFKNFELYNVAELVPHEDGIGWRMSRVPKNVRDAMNGSMMPFNTAGCEFRFVINSGTAKITLRMASEKAISDAILYYGGVQSGWQTLTHHIRGEDTVIELAPPANAEQVAKINEASGYPYSPNVIRLLLDSAGVILVDAEGDVRPPREDEVPAKRFLMYGSSITHGSLACALNNTYLSKISRRLNCDMYSFGFAGSCRLEKEMCDYIAEQGNEINPRTWDFAVMELGINALNLECDEFERRVRYLLSRVTEKNPDKKLFVIDIYYYYSDLMGDPKPDIFREIVKRCASEYPQILHIPGKELLTSIRGISSDNVHPNIDGVQEITDKLGAILEANI